MKSRPNKPSKDVHVSLPAQLAAAIDRQRLREADLRSLPSFICMLLQRALDNTTRTKSA